MSNIPSLEDLIQKNKSDAGKENKAQKTLSEVDRQFEEIQTANKAARLGYKYVNLHGFPIDLEAIALVPKEHAESAQALAFFHEEGVVRVGVVDPTSEAIEQIRHDLEKQKYKTNLFMISPSSYSEALKSYDRVVKPKAYKSDHIKLSQKDFEQRASQFFSQIDQKNKNKIEFFDPSLLLEEVLAAGVSKKVSDIHFEPEQGGVNIRFRIDGVLQDVGSWPKEAFQKIVSRIKILSRLKLNVTSKPQDGSFSITVEGRNIDFRVSVLPGVYGESLVLRLLNQNLSITLDELGITGLARERLDKALKKTTGLILNTGPTGSGKTTTLYAALQVLNKPGVKIITIENPVEYKVQGITQTPVGEKEGLTFASALRSILRQDPDIVMVGEIRDAETGNVATQAALTGHVVLSTIHANDAVSTIPRLLDLKVKPVVIVSATALIMAQRLVRRLCEECKHEVELDKATIDRVQGLLKTIPKTTEVQIPDKLQFYSGQGCEACDGLGYKGRVGIFEVFTITPDVEKLILRQAPISALRQQVIDDGMVTMVQDGLLKALQGITDVQEVFRVTD